MSQGKDELSPPVQSSQLEATNLQSPQLDARCFRHPKTCNILHPLYWLTFFSLRIYTQVHIELSQQASPQCTPLQKKKEKNTHAHKHNLRNTIFLS